ncbi:methyltransferase domain-containing protein [Dactylosporangium sp. NPDC051485]|uniref:class I SAM-dependent methyltransferase n=1 Tax=Dactylosporangium sp. NPDC051485 TaxID=3154846 RepID=UPI0034436B6D
MPMNFDAYARLQYAGMGDVYERLFGALCGHPAQRLLDLAGVTGGMRVLDAGTGPGTVGGLAVARGADVIAVDAEPSMVEVAKRRLPDVRLAVLPDLPFADGEFDAVVANFVINHLSDPGAGVRELGRVARPGGRVAVTIWPVPAPPMQRLWSEVFAAAGGRTPADAPTVAADKNYERTPDGLAGMLTAAGLRDVGAEPVEWVHRTGVEELWQGTASGFGALGALLRDESPEMVGRVRREYERAVVPYRSGDGSLAIPTGAVLGWGTAG